MTPAAAAPAIVRLSANSNSPSNVVVPLLRSVIWKVQLPPATQIGDLFFQRRAIAAPCADRLAAGGQGALFLKHAAGPARERRDVTTTSTVRLCPGSRPAPSIEHCSALAGNAEQVQVERRLRLQRKPPGTRRAETVLAPSVKPTRPCGAAAPTFLSHPAQHLSAERSRGTSFSILMSACPGTSVSSRGSVCRVVRGTADAATAAPYRHSTHVTEGTLAAVDC